MCLNCLRRSSDLLDVIDVRAGAAVEDEHAGLRALRHAELLRNVHLRVPEAPTNKLAKTVLKK